MLRLGAGLTLILPAWRVGPSGSPLLLALLSVVVAFAAVYDRCSIYRAVLWRLNEWLGQQPSGRARPWHLREAVVNRKVFSGDPARLRSPERVGRLEVPRIVAGFPAGPESKTMLDLGTGTGLFAEAFAKAGWKVSGVDVNRHMLVAARRALSQADLLVASVEALPYADNSFDLVFLGLVLHETAVPLAALREAGRITKKKVCILEWPYRETDFGPPLDERLETGFLTEIIQAAGFSGSDRVPLSHLVLLRLTK
jgi:SAM-dependent methyltransferase